MSENNEKRAYLLALPLIGAAIGYAAGEKEGEGSTGAGAGGLIGMALAVLVSKTADKLEEEDQG